MGSILYFTGVFFLAGVLIMLLAQSFRCFTRGFRRAGIVSLCLAVVPGVFFVFSQAVTAAGVFGILFCLILLIPLRRKEYSLETGTRVDERDIPFSRQRLAPGTDQYRDYYGEHPENEKRDAATRALPGLMSENSMFYSSLNCAATCAFFQLVSSMHSGASGEPASKKADISAEKIQEYIRELLAYQGFDCVGFTRVKPEHYYSHFGRRSENYGQEVPVEHGFAIVIGSKMQEKLTAAAPLTGEVLEVSLRYADSAAAAVSTASLLRNLGFSARAHIDGMYRVIPAVLARDAGVGGFGWSNLLISDIHGSAVRFSAVTTDMELAAGTGEPTDYLSFCSYCRKCAAHCPSKAIDEEKVNRIKSDRCFAYWNAAGTDCGICMAVCPMNHPWGIFRKLALRSLAAANLLPVMDDLFFGRRKKSPEMPGWMNCS